ncbi:MAG: S8 family serine peptidase [Actinobacteria bacterium]|nr:S8 family serine peptidase [Actinomycetota bacterium]
MSRSEGSAHGTRASALWGTGGRRGDGARGSVLWGKGGRSLVVLTGATIAAMLLPWSAIGRTTAVKDANGSGSSSLYISSQLLVQAQTSPHAMFNVIVQGDGSSDADHVAQQVAQFAAQANHQLADAATQADQNVQQALQQLAQVKQKLTQAQSDLAQAQAVVATKAQAASQAAKAAAAAQATAAQLATAAKIAGAGTDKNAAQKASDAANQAANAAKDLAQKATQAQQDAAQAQAQAQQKAQVVAQAQQAVAAAQAAITQAQAADSSAHAGVRQLSDQILQQQITAEFSSISGVAATLTGDEIVNLAAHPAGLLAITPNAPTQSAATPPVNYTSTQLWPYESHSAQNWGPDKDPNFVKNVPSIAIVDSGIASSLPDFGGRVVASVDLSTLADGQGTQDDNGHGTFVAGIAADGLAGITGSNPAANLVSVKVMGADGMGLTSDIINACQWILNNASTYNIKVANFSLHSDITAPFYIDPLDRAVEQLWFHGITVVVAAGNYGNTDGSPSGVIYSPGDDPFVITVGAADTDHSTDPKKAFMAPWSAYGYTPDGFFKPEISAPGRYMVAPQPAGSTLLTERPDSIIAGTALASLGGQNPDPKTLAALAQGTYIQLSGTSFAAPVVAGDAANVLAQHPTWTPDQVKGALMLTAKAGASLNGAGGVGIVQGDQAVRVNNPPNPNLGLDNYLTTSNGGSGSSIIFNAASWNSAAQSGASWNSASWNSASWNSASWNSASWNSVSWNSASWNSASWNSASWNSASWNSVAATSASREDAAEGDNTADTSRLGLAPADVAAMLSDPNFDPTSVPPDVLDAAQALLDPPAATTTTSTTTTTATFTVTSAVTTLTH